MWTPKLAKALRAEGTAELSQAGRPTPVWDFWEADIPVSRLLFITGGGTGGHVSPGLGVAALWTAKHGAGSVHWVGRRGGIEQRMAERAGLAFHAVESEALRRSLAFSNLTLPWVLWRGRGQARRLLRERRPAAVLMTGGYVGLPLGLAAVAEGVPLVLLEPNAVPGLANRLLARWADRLCLAYEESSVPARAVLTGMPCRLGTLPSRQEALAVLGFEDGRRTLLIMPGSQAAGSINAALRACLAQWGARPRPWQWLWMCGARELELCRAAAAAAPFPVRVEPFIEDVAVAYAAADLVLCRSGASTLAELGVAGKPSLQVPYPHATGDHQRENAKVFARAGAAEVMDERELTAAALASRLERLLDGDGLEAMAARARALGRGDAAQAVMAVLESAAGFD